MDSSSHPEVTNISRMKSRAKRLSPVHAPNQAPSVSPFDPRRSGQLTPVQLRALEVLHKNCAARLSEALGSQLRSTVEIGLTSVEQLTGAELLDRVPAPSYLLFLRTSFNASVLLQMDLALMFPFLDVLLGGSGTESPEPRELTEIELGILEPLARAATRSFQESWQLLLNVGFELERSAQKSEVNSRLPLGDRLLLVSFQLRFQKFEGRMMAVFPAQISGALLRKLEPQENTPLPEPSLDRSKVQERLLGSSFGTELLLPSSAVSFRQLCGLQVGDVLLLQVPAATPLEVRVAGQHRFLAAPVRSGSKRGAQVHKVLSIVPAGEEKRQ
jgi:flagellar motor switch protein FliM